MGREAYVRLTLYRVSPAPEEKLKEDVEFPVNQEERVEKELQAIVHWIKRGSGGEGAEESRGPFVHITGGWGSSLKLMIKWIGGGELISVLQPYLRQNPSLVLEVSYRDEYDREAPYHQYLGVPVTEDSLFHTLNLVYKLETRLEEDLSYALQEEDYGSLRGRQYQEMNHTLQKLEKSRALGNTS